MVLGGLRVYMWRFRDCLKVNRRKWGRLDVYILEWKIEGYISYFFFVYYRGDRVSKGVFCIRGGKYSIGGNVGFWFFFFL